MIPVDISGIRYRPMIWEVFDAPKLIKLRFPQCICKAVRKAAGSFAICTVCPCVYTEPFLQAL